MLITTPEALASYAPAGRIWQGIPSITGTAGERLFATFYSGGVREQLGNYCLLLVSDDDGASWREIAALVPEDPSAKRYFDPNVWIDPPGRLWFFAAACGSDCGLFAHVCESPDSDTLTWTDERFIGNDIMMNKPIVTRNGSWLLPIAVWNKGVRLTPELPRSDDDPIARGSFVYASEDNGETFVKRGGADVADRLYDEHMLLEKNDGSLDMFVRTNYGIGKSSSTDGGVTWSVGSDSGLGGPNSRFFITRLRSGAVLLINHIDSIGVRKNLAAMLSDDDGQTWSSPLMLDARDNVSYPDGFEAENGFIYITYDRERGAFRKSAAEALRDAREILFAKFTEADIRAGKLVTPGSKLACLISKLGEYDGDAEKLYETR